MIECRGLTRRFGDRVVVRGIDLEVHPGEIVALLGPNGAGKTTTMRMISGLIGITDGSARVRGTDVAASPEAVRLEVGMVMGEGGLYDDMRCGDYLTFFARAYGYDGTTAEQRTRKVLDLVGLADARTGLLEGFSKGMRQRVALARALIHEPSVLLLDEPTGPLDPEAAREFRAHIKGFKDAGRTIMLCTHQLAEAEQLADRIVIIRDGEIVATGTPDTIRRRSPVRIVIQFSAPVQAPPRLHKGLDVRDLRVSEDTISYMTDAPDEVNPAILQRLGRAGARVVTVTESKPSLEDVYVDIMEESHDA